MMVYTPLLLGWWVYPLGLNWEAFFTPAQLKTIRSIRKWRPPLARRFQRVSSTWSSHWGAPLSWFLQFGSEASRGVHHEDSSPLVFRQGEPIRPFFGPAPSMLWEPVRSPKCANQRPKHIQIIQPPVLVNKKMRKLSNNFVGRRIFPTAIFLGEEVKSSWKVVTKAFLVSTGRRCYKILLLMNANVVKLPKLSWFLNVQMIEKNHDVLCSKALLARWAPTSCKWSCNPWEWLYQSVTTPLNFGPTV